MVATHPHSNSSGTEASRSEPCPLCNRDHYCYHIKNALGEAIKVLCNWTDPHTPPEGWQHIGTASDGRPIFANQGYQRQRRGKKYPELISLQPQAKTDIPQWQDVHIPVEQAERGHAVKIKPEVGLGNPETVYELKEIKSGVRQGQRTLLAVLTVKGSAYGGTVEMALNDISEVVTYESETGAKEQFTEYLYSDDFKTVRHQWTDRRAVYNGKTKEIRPYHRGTDGSWIKGKGDCQPSLYRQSEAEATIRSGGIVIAVGGEQTVEHLRLLGLTAVCNQGGEGGYRQIAQDLASVFASAVENELKPLLAVWPDNDETGRKTFGDRLLKECYKNGVTAVAIDPLALWPDMPPGGDAYNWIDHCKKFGLSDQEMIRQLEFAIDEAIDRHEEEIRNRWQREAWEAPMTNNGEIGRWLEQKQGEQIIRKWKPLCNFDFQVERELEDTFGGGLVLQVKRSFEKRQYRVLLNSTDYTSVDKFVDALKLAMGTGVVCNLTKHELGALIHTRLHEYRTNRSGRLYKRIDRYGQQADGVWVFRERQYTSDGKPTSENETGWVFNPSLGKDDYIPCPELAPEDPKALKCLVDAARRFYGAENFYQVLLTMGWVVAGLHSQTIFKHENCFPLFNSHGEPGSCKTLAAETALSFVGFNWPDMGMLARVSPSALYEHGSRTGSLPFFWDDPERKPEFEELAKSWYNWKPRKVRGNEQTPHSPMGVTSNHVFGGDQSATLTRFARSPFKRFSGGDKDAFQELKQAQRLASGAFPILIQLGYPRKEIASLERELLPHLPLAHARIAQSLGLVTYYAQKLVEMTGGSEDVWQWVITNLCQAENDAENVGDSMHDFISKILSLSGQDLIGDWNKQTVSTKDGRSWVAIHSEDVWGLVDRHFKPATYNKKSLKSLVLAAGGQVDSVQRFALSRDEVLTYYAAQISPRRDQDGNEILPNPPRTVTRKAWLLPVELFEGGDTPPGAGGDGGSNCPLSPQFNPSFSGSNLEPKGAVTAVTKLLPKTVTSQNAHDCVVSAVLNASVTTVTKKIDQIEIEQNQATLETSDSSRTNPVTNSGNGGNTVTAEAETQSMSRLKPVTSSVTGSDSNSVTKEDMVLSPTPAQQQATLALNDQTYAEVQSIGETERNVKVCQSARPQGCLEERNTQGQPQPAKPSLPLPFNPSQGFNRHDDPSVTDGAPVTVGDRVEIVLTHSRYQGQTGIVRRVFQDQGLTLYAVQIDGTSKKVDYQRSDLRLAGGKQ